ncbi:CARDB domain-containing protein [Halapricum hydrolyticum]|uniref:CARDB domain-containing protein n=1 Tax=Halapricum hydrolyticum TaxID=2979991 RepID=A0AAE3ICH1_9EURY|nr:CARDB domain-containing protein [Halapricum hydrolyticum]MCU4717564.1 hypothetical protein [Halapricum hydrolyticum]MCU4726728.1 hypothetical protein [Halapricum hydrolyticum]
MVDGSLKSGSFHAIPTGSDGSLRNARVDTDGAIYGVAPDRIYSVQQSILNSEVENRVFGEVEGAVRDVYWSPEISGTTSQHGTALSREQMTGPQAREHMDGLDFEEVWAATDDLPVQQWRIQDLSLDLAEDRILVDESTEVTVTLELAASNDTTATTTAEYDVNTSAASIENGTLQSTDRGTAEVTASLAGHTDTATVKLLAPPDLGVAETTLDEPIVARDTTVSVDATVENVGDLEGTETFGLQVDNETIESTSVTVDGRDEQSVAFRWTPTETGSYTPTVGGEIAGTLEVVEPPEVSVTDASLATETLLVGQEATVSATLENPDRLAGSETATLLAEDTVVQTRDVTVGAEETNTTAFAWTPSEPGTYNLTVNSIAAGSVEVVPRSTITVANVTATDQVVTGEAADVTATIVNEANVPVDVPVSYALDGEQVATELVTLEPGTSAVTFEQPLAEAGAVTHTVEAVNDKASTETDVREPATVEITNVVSPDTVETGSDAGVTVTVENSGGVAGNDTVEFSVDGATLSDEPIALDAGENTRVSASFAFSLQGEHTFTVETSDGSASGTIVAESPSGDDTTTDQETEQTTDEGGQTDRETDESGQTDDGETTRQDDAAESGDGFGPGFGVVAALLAIVILGVALARLDS